MDDKFLSRHARDVLLGERRQCTGTSRSGERCNKAPLLGQFVCEMHGGKAPLSIQAGKERLAILAEPALEVLYRAMRTAPPCEHCGRSDSDRDPVVLRAAQLVLDRAGYHPTLAVQVAPAQNQFANATPEELEEHALRLAEMARALRRAEQFALAPCRPDDVDGGLLPEVTDTLLALTDAFVVPDDDEPVAIQNEEQPIPVGNETPEEGNGEK